VCGFNEGCVPKTQGADLFLPDGLRARLGLEDSNRRFARDAYALQLVLTSRERVDLVVGRRDTEQEPLVPSPLLFAADGETVARRALEFFRPVAESRRPLRLPGALVAKRTRANLPVPKPQPLAEPITSLRSTGFRDYLECPYRFYLRHVLKLMSIDDQIEELDGGAFGRLLHEALLRFGRSEARDSTDAEAIAAMLNESLDVTAAEMYGGQSLAPLQVQIEQLRLRLEAFAVRQAQRASEGWRIEHVEVDRLEAVLDVDGEPFTVTGRIDRIDVHRDTGEHLVLDYKSSDSARSPRKAHLDKDEWVDLQLPLYRHLARDLGIEGAIHTGYIVLPKEVSEVDFLLDDWTDEELEDANETALDVVRRIRAGEFWPPKELSDYSYDDWADICQSGVFDSLLEGEGDAA
jgi:RecB family exonuclease